MSVGIGLIIQGMLGTSPISAVPYIVSLNYPYSLGLATFVFNMLLILMQVIILGKKSSYLHFMQIPVTVVFSVTIDIAMSAVGFIQPEIYFMKIIVMIIGCAILAAGVTLEVIGNVVMLPGEGIVSAVAERFKTDFGYTKIGFDSSMVLLAVAISWLCSGEIHGIREGTLISAFLVGNIVRFYLPRFSYIDEYGNLIFRLQLKKRKLEKMF
jgi:uncharacterized membrane protein YczE